MGTLFKTRKEKLALAILVDFTMWTALAVYVVLPYFGVL